MNFTKLVNGSSAPPAIAALVYGGLLLVLIAATVLPLKGVLDQRMALEQLGETLRQLDARGPAAAHPEAAADAAITGSAFLEGPTVTVAGAALLQRVVGVVNRHGGSVSSSQPDLQGTEAKDGFVSVTANFDLEQPELQQIVYDLEAGMPFLFVDELVIQGPSPAAASDGKLHVLISVSGQWQSPQ
ncbi:type II secretion system protein GspM [Bradyrhizobium sp.]|uniref:type II secretion system protein GspM n=1 Tax=Bradyrhizobium sp. TaxID=376 RepID=UPI001D403D67|nr:type II secretion system protein GspM [Bradyrhizobium sp.]MBV8696773.1 type II secretion system protein M [Bradyrhizobium sp.]MBV8917252.1 type II secretion system protein M [Bradyrhizobium sp.]MBV9985787.1 type II secretion system protein M [Bradyrhizobium sp.]